MQADPSAVVNSDNCAQLFAHEATRVFHDRLTDLEDRTSFFSILADTLHDFFKVCKIIELSDACLLMPMIGNAGLVMTNFLLIINPATANSTNKLF